MTLKRFKCSSKPSIVDWYVHVCVSAKVLIWAGVSKSCLVAIGRVHTLSVHTNRPCGTLSRLIWSLKVIPHLPQPFWCLAYRFISQLQYMETTLLHYCSQQMNTCWITDFCFVYESLVSLTLAPQWTLVSPVLQVYIWKDAHPTAYLGITCFVYERLGLLTLASALHSLLRLIMILIHNVSASCTNVFILLCL